MSDVALANEPEIRTPTGEIKDQTPSPTSTPTPEKSTEKPAETKPTEAKPEAKAEKPSLVNEKEPQGAPTTYEAFKVPEGHEMDEATFKEVGELFKELHLSQAEGQKAVDYWVKRNQEAFDAPFKAWEDTQAKWVSEVKADPEMGSRIPEIKATIGKALDGLGDSKLANDFRAAMDYTGAGNNPAFVKAFWKLSQMLTEGGHVAGTGPSPLGQRAPGAADRPTAAKSLYPNLP